MANVLLAPDSSAYTVYHDKRSQPHTIEHKHIISYVHYLQSIRDFTSQPALFVQVQGTIEVLFFDLLMNSLHEPLVPYIILLVPGERFSAGAHLLADRALSRI